MGFGTCKSTGIYYVGDTFALVVDVAVHKAAKCVALYTQLKY